MFSLNISIIYSFSLLIIFYPEGRFSDKQISTARERKKVNPTKDGLYNFEKKDSKSAEKTVALPNKKSRKDIQDIESRIENTWKEKEQEISDRNRLENLKLKRDSSERRARALQEKLNLHLNGSKKISNHLNNPTQTTDYKLGVGYGVSNAPSSKPKKHDEADILNVNKLIQNRSLKNFIEGAAVEHRVLEKLMHNDNHHGDQTASTGSKSDHRMNQSKNKPDSEYLRRDMINNNDARYNNQDQLILNNTPKSQARDVNVASDKKRATPLKETPKHHHEEDFEKNEVSTEELNHSQHRVQLSEVEEETWRVNFEKF